MNNFELLSHDFDTLCKLQDTPGIPNIHSLNINEINFESALQNFGTPLQNAFIDCQNKFSTKTVLKLATQLLNLLENIHKLGLVCGSLDINNLSIQMNDPNHVVFLTDFKQNGSSMFTSCEYDSRETLHPKSDLESLGYLAIYLLKGELPWEKLYRDSVVEPTYLANAQEVKSSASLKELWYGLPIEILLYMRYVDKLNKNSMPDFKTLKSLFLEKLNDQNANSACFQYDWQIDHLDDSEDMSWKLNKSISSMSSFDPMAARVIDYQISEFKKVYDKK